MPSIRRSLILYFLLLLGVALGSVAVLMDQFAADFSRAREADGARRIDTEYQYRRQEIEQRFNEQLEKQAEDLGLGVRWKFHYIRQQEWERDRERGRELQRMDSRERGAEEQKRRARIADATTPLALAGGSLWPTLVKETGLSNSPRHRFALDDIVRWPQNEDVIRKSFLEGDDHVKDHPKFFLFQFPTGRRQIRSPYPQADLSPLPADELAQIVPPKLRIDDVTVNGVVLRRVVLKAPFGGGPFRGWLDPTRTPQFLTLGSLVGGAPFSAPQTVPPDRGMDPVTFVYVHCARPKADLDDLWAVQAATQNAELAELARETRAATARLRLGLAVIAVVAFVALAGGAWLLVGRGVSPLRKLSEAVSRVSEKDFHLSMDQQDLSHELVPIHDRLTHTLAELGRAFEREKQAVADISHELRTPVAALLTTLDVSLRKPRSADQYRQTMEECRTITRQLGQLVERVMTLAYLDAGQTRVSRSRVPAAEVVAGCATVIRPLAEARGLTFTLSADPAVEVDTDRDKLREVLLNLLHNAVEYTDPGGSVELAVHPNGGGRVAFDVRDTGIGMTGEVRGKIFERFFRADPSRTETGVHAGLGLAIVKEYVERLGGSITVETAPGKGSLFRVELPGVTDDAEVPQLAT